MRKIKYIIAGISAAVFMVSCELDNFDGPDAQVYGAVIDAETAHAEWGIQKQSCFLRYLRCHYE